VTTSSATLDPSNHSTGFKLTSDFKPGVGMEKERHFYGRLHWISVLIYDCLKVRILEVVSSSNQCPRKERITIDATAGNGPRVESFQPSFDTRS
jgi:hypothetical protein